MLNSIEECAVHCQRNGTLDGEKEAGVFLSICMGIGVWPRVVLLQCKYTKVSYKMGEHGVFVFLCLSFFFFSITISFSFSYPKSMVRKKVREGKVERMRGKNVYVDSKVGVIQMT